MTFGVPFEDHTISSMGFSSPVFCNILLLNNPLFLLFFRFNGLSTALTSNAVSWIGKSRINLIKNINQKLKYYKVRIVKFRFSECVNSKI